MKIKENPPKTLRTARQFLTLQKFLRTFRTLLVAICFLSSISHGFADDEDSHCLCFHPRRLIMGVLTSSPMGVLFYAPIRYGTCNSPDPDEVEAGDFAAGSIFASTYGLIPPVMSLTTKLCNPTSDHPGRYASLALYTGLSFLFGLNNYVVTEIELRKRMYAAGGAFGENNSICDQWTRSRTYAVGLLLLCVIEGTRTNYEARSDGCLPAHSVLGDVVSVVTLLYGLLPVARLCCGVSFPWPNCGREEDEIELNTT